MWIRQRVPRALLPAARASLLGLAGVTGPWRMDPSFIVIGGQRCGTTTIFKTLAQHPQVLRPPVDKGTDYYTLHYDRGRSWYRRRMPLAATGQRRAAGYGPPQAFEACTYYLFHPFAVERISRDFPDIKLVAMLRDPVERAYSAYKHELARGYEIEADFRRALELEDERLSGEIERMAADVSYESFPHRHHAYRRRGQFAEQLERVYAHYPRERVHVMDSEAFFADPRDEYRKLVTFLGLAPWEPASIDRHNARSGSPMPPEAHEFLSDHYRDHNERLADLLGRRPGWRSD